MDAKTGQVLYEKNSNNQYMPASTTKIMTAILALEKCNLTDEVTISENPPKADGSSIGIEQGEVYTIEELLIGLLLESGNDCAEAIAEHIESVSGFLCPITKIFSCFFIKIKSSE